jgi:hypothetical protein
LPFPCDDAFKASHHEAPTFWSASLGCQGPGLFLVEKPTNHQYLRKFMMEILRPLAMPAGVLLSGL